MALRRYFEGIALGSWRICAIFAGNLVCTAAVTLIAARKRLGAMGTLPA